MAFFVFNNHERHPFGRFFQLRWKERLGRPECPYLYRWTLIICGYTVRLHHWIKSDDNRHFHDHACNLVSIILKGFYYNVVPVDDSEPDVANHRRIRARAWRPWRAKATAKHYLEIPKGGAWTLLFQGRPYHKWGFYVRNQKTGQFVKHRPLRYFSKFGIIQDESYQ
jgi:hypothetical protein